MIVAPTRIRTRLTLWYAHIMVLILAVFAFGTFAYVRESLFAQIDARLDESLAIIAKATRSGRSDLAEIEQDNRVRAFRVAEGDWPVYESGGWAAADLNATGTPPQRGRWIVAPTRGGLYHLKEMTLVLGDQKLRITTAEQSEQIHRVLDRLALTFWFGFPAALLLSLLGGYFLAGRMLRPLQHITERARTISADNLSERLAVANPQDELGQLSAILNDAFARLDETFDRLKRFTQDAAHELRTPLAVLRSVGEVGLQEPRDPAAYRDIIGSMLEEVDRLGRLVDGLLTLARAESGRFSLAKRPEALHELAQEVVECLLVLAEEKHQSLICITEQALVAEIDRDTVRLALMNVIANAIRFTPEGGAIRVTLRASGAAATIEIQDNGPGIAQAHHAHIFERFYRVDPSRAHHTGGSGLGLAIARWAIGANNGHITMQSTPGDGCLFTIALPTRP